MPPTSSLTYRPEIDGLRAIAVLAVVVFHIHALAGGFVGVDIFFVISGYLISSIIVGEMQAGSFSLARFYERRIKRILPALLVMLLTVLIVCLFVFSPDDTAGVAKTAAAAALSFSNVYFALNATFFTAYFNAPAATQPLLHTWSLGVEEQFYFVFPLLLVLGQRYFPRHLVLAVVGVLLVSLAMSTDSALHKDDAAFYWLHDRAWELALGMLLALNAVPALTSRLWREIVAALGLLAMLASIAIVDTHMPIPGIVLLPACLGTAAVIHAGQNTLTGKLLSLKPVVFVGAISYSLYLWHWPVFVFQQTNWLFYAGESRVLEKSAVLVLSFALAMLSWKFVEQPFRERSWKPSKAMLFGGAAASVVLVSAVSAAIAWTGGVPSFLPKRQYALEPYLHYSGPPGAQDRACFPESGEDFARTQLACLALSSTKKNVLLMGDSHAHHLDWGLEAVLSEAKVSMAAMGSCRPILSYRTSSYPGCRHMLDYMFGDFLPRHARNIDLVVLSAQWQNDQIGDLFRTVAMLKRLGIPVIVIGPVMRYDKQLVRLLILEERLGDPTLHNRHAYRDRFALDSAMAARAQREHVPYVSLIARMCRGFDCMARWHDAPMQWDNAHLTAEGSIFLMQKASASLRGVMR